jgi:A/G-specific adenine glycosylase
VNERLRPVSPATATAFRRRLLAWSRRHPRELFWRREPLSPFGVLLIEILLSRTRAEAVEPIARSLLASFPVPERLAGQRTPQVEGLLRPLGLHRKRARQLIDCAGRLAEDHEGRVPRDLQSLLALPGVGLYAASAVLCFAYGRRRAIVDANVARVYTRCFGFGRTPRRLATARQLWSLAERMLPLRRVRAFNWALLDLGSRVCLPLTPRCGLCPLATSCTFQVRRSAVASRR